MKMRMPKDIGAILLISTEVYCDLPVAAICTDEAELKCIFNSFNLRVATKASEANTVIDFLGAVSIAHVEDDAIFPVFE